MVWCKGGVRSKGVSYKSHEEIAILEVTQISYFNKDYYKNYYY